MKRRHDSGFTVVEVLVVLFSVAILIMIGSWAYARLKTAHKLQNVIDHKKVDDAKPTLQNLGGIYLAAYNKNTGLAGDIKFDGRLVDPAKGLETQTYIFGQKIEHDRQSNRLNPSLDFRGINRQIDVLAATDGQVLSVRNRQDSSDYELVLAKSDNSTWQISYDHLVDLKTKRGDRVVAGQVLGKAAPYRNGTYYYEIQVNHMTSPLGDITEYVCPTTLLDSSVRSAYVESINLMIRDWITFRTKDAYGPQDGGCVKPAVEAREVEG